ncbi:hypothetical protein CYMTET_30358 [Cymbomonas tetramitiformis]|uniref:Uncharacterized protein n=1 Tax=Cymbomonas tetramitiformis TaxID=36881 RepID=A0AAE0FJ88_9CHLO|nr:hypothetical protein CYMTET_30358 [Cymbomonas tetramitiformis]
MHAQVRVFDPVLGEYEKEMDLKELLLDLTERHENPWAALAVVAQHWARGHAAVLKTVSYAEFEHLMRQMEDLDLDAHSSDEEKDAKEASIARRARQRFRTGKQAMQRHEQKMAQRAMEQAKLKRQELKNMQQKAALLKETARKLRNSDAVASLEAARQAASIESGFEALNALVEQAQHKAYVAGLAVIGPKRAAAVDIVDRGEANRAAVEAKAQVTRQSGALMLIVVHAIGPTREMTLH